MVAFIHIVMELIVQAMQGDNGGIHTYNYGINRTSNASAFGHACFAACATV